MAERVFNISPKLSFLGVVVGEHHVSLGCEFQVLLEYHSLNVTEVRPVRHSLVGARSFVQCCIWIYLSEVDYKYHRPVPKSN